MRTPLPHRRRRINRLVTAAATTAALTATTLAGVTTPAWAGTTGVDPATCGTGATWSYVDYNVNGAIMREELRHSYGCGGVGWGRLSKVGGSSPALALIQSAWNPGGPSQDGVPGSNWTYTVNANPGMRVCAGFQAYSVDSLGNWHYIGWFFVDGASCYIA